MFCIVGWGLSQNLKHLEINLLAYHWHQEHMCNYIAWRTLTLVRSSVIYLLLEKQNEGVVQKRLYPGHPGSLSSTLSTTPWTTKSFSGVSHASSNQQQFLAESQYLLGFGLQFVVSTFSCLHKIWCNSHVCLFILALTCNTKNRHI